MKDLTVNWIRHGVSCGNIKNIGDYITFNYKKNIDPSLFYESMLTSIFIKKHIPKSISSNQLILCSSLVRSIQTAILMFPKQFKKKQIKIIFNVNEIGMGVSQIKQDKENLKIILIKFIKLIISDKKLNNVCKFKNTDVKKINNLFTHLESNNNKNHYTNFRSEILDICTKNKIDKINIVSHSRFIKKKVLFNNDVDYLKKQKYINNKKEYLNYFKDDIKKLHNNQIVQVKYTIDNENKINTEKIKSFYLGVMTLEKKMLISAYTNKYEKKILNNFFKNKKSLKLFFETNKSSKKKAKKKLKTFKHKFKSKKILILDIMDNEIIKNCISPIKTKKLK